MATTREEDRLRQALAAFVSTVECTGGVVQQADGLHAPVADEDWVDIGEAYMEACDVLRRPAKVEPYILSNKEG